MQNNIVDYKNNTSFKSSTFFVKSNFINIKVLHLKETFKYAKKVYYFINRKFYRCK